MRQDEEDHPSKPNTPASDSFLRSKSRTSISPTKSIVRFQNQRIRVYNSRYDLPLSFREDVSPTSSSRMDSLHFPTARDESDKRYKAVSKMTPGRDVKVFSNSKFIVSDCWKSVSGEAPVELVELFKESEPEEDHIAGGMRRRRLSQEDKLGGPLEKLSYTKEFHVLTEVQKERILTAVEDAIKKLSNKDVYQEEQARPPETRSLHSDVITMEKFYCKKFLLPWVIMKVVEMVVCHIIQLTFLSNEAYFIRKYEFLPVVVTYYFTLFIIIFSLVMHIICYSFGGIQHPCYFMCIISSSILTLTTTLGVMIMLCSMDYYESFREILVLLFIAALLCSLIAELCICYIEVKNFWNRVQNTDQYYIS